MNISFDGMNQWAATFATSDAVEGHVVKMTAGATVGACTDGDSFCGVTAAKRAGDACAVQLAGVVTAPYTGTAPTVGYAKLSANGTGGVKASSTGREYLVLDIDPSANTVTFVL